jgi:ribonuclease HI
MPNAIGTISAGQAWRITELLVRCGVENSEIYTDGGCHGNPGPGAWAFVITSAGDVVERSGAARDTTNNRMELTAVIEALREVGRRRIDGTVTIHTDSQYVKNGITTWIRTWLANGWRTSSKQPVKNQDLWVELHDLNRAIGPDWRWVRGHAGNPLNERCDALVQEAIGRL